jgi:hypothetical protein
LSDEFVPAGGPDATLADVEPTLLVVTVGHIRRVARSSASRTLSHS